MEPGACGVDKFVAFVERLKGIVVETLPSNSLADSERVPLARRDGQGGSPSWRTGAGGAEGAVVELMPYITGAFGNEVRIDYGTGHELFFALFFLCLFKLRIIGERELNLVVLRAFDSYLSLMRLLQHTYMLEPAGSHGVWGLDDYHCLVFLWGSAQLCKQEGNNEYLTPKCIHEKDVLDEYSKDYLYLGAIQAIKRMKTGAPFAEIAPMLNDISQLPEWSKLLMGLLKSVQAEVMLKLPVVQHVVFGGIVLARQRATRRVG